MKPSLNSCASPEAQVIDKLTELANRQADLLDSFPGHYRDIPVSAKRQLSIQFDEFIVQLDSLVAKLESTVQKRRVQNRKAMAQLQSAIRQADREVSTVAEETAKLPELARLTGEFQGLRQSYRETLTVLDGWIHQLDGQASQVSLAA